MKAALWHDAENIEDTEDRMGQSEIRNHIGDSTEMVREVDETESGPCWFCGKPSEHRFRAKTGWNPGPYHYSPHVEYCEAHLSDCIDWLEAVAKDLKAYRKARKR